MKPALRRPGIVLATVAAMTFGALAATSGAQAGTPIDTENIAAQIGEVPGTTVEHTYIVEMAGQPVVAYDGSIAGLKATRPSKGSKIDPNSAAVTKYVEYLDASHANALAKVGGTVGYDYRYSYNGFTAELTDVEASKLLSQPDVLAVTKDQKLQLATADTPRFLGLEDEGSLWSRLGGPVASKNRPSAGDGVIVGIIDSGIWPENASFSDRGANGKRVFQQIPGWHGKCVPGQGWIGSNCNQKLIGAQWFNSGFGGNAGIRAQFPYEFLSTRDYDGHGSHTASTAAGNHGVRASVEGLEYEISGIAPGARIAAYKVCWGTGDEGGCFGADSVAAIDRAVADGVDVLNFSISGSLSSFRDPVEIAFLFANDAGVFVAASAGNSGPDASTVAHNSPWLTTVAASTHDRASIGAFISNIDGEEYVGASLASREVTAELVDAGTAAAAGASDDDARLCVPGSLDPVLVTGKIALCDRGAIARTDKSLAVKQAGGVGMVLVNVGVNSVNADVHFVPSVHVQDDDQNTTNDALHAAFQLTGATGTILEATPTTAIAPAMAPFSSRGPALAGAGDQLSPDITAPGVDVLAAVSPAGNNGRNHDFLSGTSMSGPHIAGVGALLSDLHPTWSPAAMRSAIMTTAYQTDTAGDVFGDVFDFGAGHVAPNTAADPGLVYDANIVDYLGFLCGGTLGQGFCDANGIPTLDPSDLNQASIAIGSLAGTQTITRTVTNVGQAGTYTVDVQDVDGVDVVVSPSSFDIGAGQSVTYTVTFTTNSSATLNEYTSGAIVWTDGVHSVRSPVAVRPVAVAAPEEITATGDTSYEVGFGFSGDFSTDVRGLIAAEEIVGTVVDDPDNDINASLASGVGYTLHVLEVPAGTTVARFSLFDEFTSGADDDLDLYIFDGGFNFVGQSGSGTSDEQVDVVNPTSAVYVAIVHGWQTDGGVPSDYTLFNFNVPADDLGNMTVDAPSPVVQGDTGEVSLSFDGLVAGTKYMGAVDYTLAGAAGGSTIIRVDP